MKPLTLSRPAYGLGVSVVPGSQVGGFPSTKGSWAQGCRGRGRLRPPAPTTLPRGKEARCSSEPSKEKAVTCNMTHTGIFASEEERGEIQELASTAQGTPMIKLASNQPDFAETAWRRTKERLHAVALSKGLPEIEGFYGMTPEGEFINA